ncbi:vancomycin permeability regulator SanA [Actinokineospora auranticolor]|uniref:Vancomycin permeability regulator SanA n=1 Tax=Actinokineospora auranticolor TaxID=155976 RepID=A0A2S6GGD6_9PSEU|nr:vancomycin permeability regulator SanA [Actinokineospora auranticolor]
MLIASAVAFVLGVLFGPLLWIRVSTGGGVYGVADAPSAPVAIVLGAGLRSDGTPKPYLEARLADARTLYESGRVRAILVSGDHGTPHHDEVAAMTTWLVDRGVPAERVVADHAGFDTYDSCVRAREIFGVSKAVVVTQGFHIRRAVFLCRNAGIEAVGVASEAPGGNDGKYWLREVPAAIKAVFDAVFDPDPRFLGPREHGLDQVLAEG